MRDYAAPWFRARRAQGVDDTIIFGVLECASGQRHSFTMPHEQADGVGAFMNLLRRLGVRDWQGVTGRPGVIPGLLECWRSQRPAPAHEAPCWRYREVSEETSQAEILVSVLPEHETEALAALAKARRVSLNALLLEQCHQVVRHHLLVQGSGSWFVPVTLRGSLALASDEMNHASGLYVALAEHAGAEQIQQDISAALKRNEHWWLWHQSRLVVTLGGDWLVRRVLGWLGQKKFIGSFSSMGEWRIDWRGSGFAEDSVMWGCPPGSPNYPVAVCWLICNGRLVLSWKLNPVLGVSAAYSQALLRQWQQQLSALVASSVTNAEAEHHRESCHA